MISAIALIGQISVAHRADYLPAERRRVGRVVGVGWRRHVSLPTRIIRRPGAPCEAVEPSTFQAGRPASRARIKKQLLTECNLHTVVRLPDGAFAPYTDIPSNLLFFDKSGPLPDPALAPAARTPPPM